MEKMLHDLIDIIQFTERVGARIHSLRDEVKIYRSVCEEFLASEHYMAGILLLTPDGEALRVANVSFSSDVLASLEALFDSTMEEFRISLGESQLLKTVIDTGITLETTAAAVLDCFLSDSLRSRVMTTIGIGDIPSVMTPIYRRGAVIGILIVTAPKLAEYFCPSLRNLAGHISLALELAQEYRERERVEEDLRRSEEYYRFLIEYSSDMVVVLDADGTIRYASPSVERLTAYEISELIGKSAFEFIHPDERAVARDMYARLIGNPGSDISFEVQLQAKKGGWRYFELTARNALDEPAIGGVVCHYHDIDVRKRVENALRESEERYRALFDNTAIPITYLDLDGRALLVNSVGASNLGLAPGDFIGRPIHETMPGVAQLTMERIREVASFERGAQFEDLIELPGGPRWFFSDFQPVRDSTGNVFAVQIVSQDVTDRKRMEEALRQSESRYRQLFDHAPDGVFILDPTGTIVECSHSAMLLYGYSKEEMVNRHITMFTDWRSVPGLPSGFPSAYPVQPFEGEVRIRRSDGNIVHIWRKGIPLNDANGNTAGILAYDRDITDRKRAEDLLQRHRDQLEELLRERTCSLEETVTALRVVMKTADELKEELENNLRSNLRKLVLPILEELKKSDLNDRQESFLAILERNLDQLVSPLWQGPSARFVSLTPIEMMIVDFVKQGKTNKDIANLLNLSTSTVETYRYKIRSKLGVKDRSVNLREYILTLE